MNAEDSITIPAGSGQLVVDRAGVAYRDRHYGVVAPWHGILLDTPVVVGDDGAVAIALCSPEPGVAFVVEKAQYSTDDLYEECPARIEGAFLYLPAAIAGDMATLARLVTTRRQAYAQRVDGPLRRSYTGKGGAVRAVNFRAGTVDLDRRCPLRYPAFCPVTGGVASEALPIACEGGGAPVPFLVSDKALMRERWGGVVRRGATFASVAVYALLGVVLAPPAESGAPFPWGSAMGGISVFGAVPLAFWMTRPKILVEALGRDEVRVSFDDREYFEAFVTINGSATV